MILNSGTVSGLETTVDIVSPGGQVATIDISDQITIGATTTSLLVGSATVVVDGLSASLSDTELDVADLDSSITDAIQSGTAVLEISNPFGVTFDGTITVGPVVKSVSVTSAPTSTVNISFTGDELRSFLGQPGATFSGSGTLGGGPAVVSPGTDMSIDASIDLLIEIGG
jgi:hypothetical protein